MSREAQIAIGVITIFGAVCSGLAALACQLIGPDTPYQVPGLAAICGVCVVAAIACFARSGRALTLRIIGVVFFFVFAGYLIHEMNQEAAGQESSLARAIVGFVVIGLPALYVAIFADYPRWGRWSAAFKSESNAGDGR